MAAGPGPGGRGGPTGGGSGGGWGGAAGGGGGVLAPAGGLSVPRSGVFSSAWSDDPGGSASRALLTPGVSAPDWGGLDSQDELFGKDFSDVSGGEPPTHHDRIGQPPELRS